MTGLKTNLHRIAGSCFAMALLVLAIACGGSDGDDPQPEPKGLVLKADKNTVNNSGDDRVVFTVLYDGKDVTGSSSIVEQNTHTAVKDGVFSAGPNDKAGTYVFVATYQKYTSEAVNVEVRADAFVKHVLMMQFTSNTCIYCPGMTEILENDVVKLAPGRICLMSFHRTMNQPEDPYDVAEYVDPMKRHFQFNTYPTVILEHTSKWEKDNASVQKYLNTAADAGIAVTTSLSGQKLTATVKVKGAKDFSTDCVVAVALLENGLKYMQSTTTSPVMATHNQVVRRYLTDLFGDAQSTGSGKIAADTEWSRTFNTEIPAEWVIGNMDLIVYVLDGDGKAMNCCKVKLGESVDYK